jgi:hypothetical protein
MKMQDIRAGDKVIVVYPSPCCGADRGLGRVYEAHHVEGGILALCDNCGKIYSDAIIVYEDEDSGYLLQQVRKLPDLKIEKKMKAKVPA